MTTRKLLRVAVLPCFLLIVSSYQLNAPTDLLANDKLLLSGRLHDENAVVDPETRLGAFASASNKIQKGGAPLKPEKDDKLPAGSVSVKRYYKLFSSKEALESVIRQWNGDEKFFKTYEKLFTNAPLAKYVNGLPEVTRRGVKERLAKVVNNLEGTTAYEIEASDWDVDLRHERGESSAAQQGKTGVFVILFHRLLDFMFGREYLEKKLEAGRSRRRIMDRLNEMGIAHEVDEAELDKIQKAYAERPPPYKGVPFNPFTIKEWPDKFGK